MEEGLSLVCASYGFSVSTLFSKESVAQELTQVRCVWESKTAKASYDPQKIYFCCFREIFRDPLKHIIHRLLKEATETAIDFVTQTLGFMS